MELMWKKYNKYIKNSLYMEITSIYNKYVNIYKGQEIGGVLQVNLKIYVKNIIEVMMV